MISFKKLPSIVLTILSLLISGSIFPQTKKNNKIAKPASKIQVDTTKASGVYSALVYFSGNGLPNVKVYTCYGADLGFLMKNIDSASNGAIVTFDHLNFTDSKGATKAIKEIPYNFNRSKDKAQFKSQPVQEIEKLKTLNFISGTIYFTGFAFINVSSTKASDTTTLYKYYDRSGSGTTIILDNCVYKNANGSLSNPLSKSVKL